MRHLTCRRLERSGKVADFEQENGDDMMCIDRVPYETVRPTWANPVTNMRVRYLSHPDLRLAFIQTIDDPEFVYVVSDQVLPVSLDEAHAVAAQWRVDNGQTP